MAGLILDRYQLMSRKLMNSLLPLLELQIQHEFKWDFVVWLFSKDYWNATEFSLNHIRCFFLVFLRQVWKGSDDKCWFSNDWIIDFNQVFESLRSFEISPRLNVQFLMVLLKSKLLRALSFPNHSEPFEQDSEQSPLYQGSCLSGSIVCQRINRI